VHLVPLTLVDQWAERDLFGGRVAYRQVVRLFGQCGDVVVVDCLMHQVSAGGHADLALVQERTPRARRDRGRQVDVVQDDQCRVAAQFQMYPLEVLRGQFADSPAGGGGTGERHDSDAWLGDHCLARVDAAGQHVQQAVG
jgi:hypothetical protein